MAMELKRQASDLDVKITTIKGKLRQLTQRRDAVEPNTSLAEIETIINEIKSSEANLEKLQLLRMAVQKPLNNYANNAPKAPPLITRVKATHDHARGVYARFLKHQEVTAADVKELNGDNETMSGLAKEFYNLVGEDMNLPFPIRCPQAEAFAAAEPIKPDAYPAWTFISESALAAKHKEELDKKLEQHEIRLKLAESLAPMCVRCARANLETKMIVDRRSGRRDTPGESLSHGQWYLVCPKCGAIQTIPIPETRNRDQVVSIASGSAKPRTKVRHPDF